MRYKRFLVWTALLTVLISVRAISAQGNVPTNENFCDQHTKDFDIFFNCLFSNETTAFLGQKDRSKQVEMTSMAENSPSLVDQTAAPDIMGLAFNLFGGQTKSDGDNNMAGTITFSAYSLYAGISGNKPLDPAFYNPHRNLRRFSFTVGQDNGTGTGTGSKPATILGAKILLLDTRDLSTGKNRDELKKLSDSVRAASGGITKAQDETQIYLYNAYAAKNGKPTFEERRAAIRAIANQAQRVVANQAFSGEFNTALSGKGLSDLIAGLTPQQKKEIRAIIINYVSETAPFTQEQIDIVDKIRRKPQLSLTFQSKLRKGNDPDEYRAGLLFDLGFTRIMNLTINGTYDYKKSHIIGGDQRGGRFALESNFLLGSLKKTLAGPEKPILFSIAGEGKWMNALKPTFTGQAKISIPLLVDGVSLPISVSYGNRPDLVQGNYIRGNFGLTFDLGKLLSERLKKP